MARRTDDTLRIKRRYLTWLRDAKGLSETSVDKAAAAIDDYVDWLGGRDLSQFNSERAVAFKRHLSARKTPRGTIISDTTVNGILRELRGFFLWLGRGETGGFAAVGLEREVLRSWQIARTAAPFCLDLPSASKLQAAASGGPW